ARKPRLAARAALAGARTTGPQDPPADVAPRAYEVDRARDLGERAVEHDRLLRQPFERTGNDEREPLPRPRTGRAVPLGRSWRGEERQSAVADARGDLEVVAARDACRGGDHDRGAAPVPLWVE